MNLPRGIAEAAVAAAMLAVSACSSGDDPVAETISLDRTAVAYVLARGETQYPAPEAVTATYSGTSISVDMVPGAFHISTLNVVPMGADGQGVMPYEIHLDGISFSGPSGRYVTGLRFTTARADGSGAGYVDLPLVFDVVDRLAVNPGSMDFMLSAGQQETRDIQVYAEGIDWTAQPDQGWIALGTAGASGDATTTIGVDSAGLSPGDHAGHVVFTETVSGHAVTVPISLHVAS